jgi:hypothetical protein
MNKRSLYWLNIEVLFRLLINRLWCGYDSGGISIRRSYQATLVEGFMDLFPVDWRYCDVVGDVFGEVKFRVDRHIRAKERRDKQNLPKQQKFIQCELPFVELSVLSNVEFTLLSLEELCRWYEEESERKGFLYRHPVNTSFYLKNLCEICFRKSLRRRVPLGSISKEAIVFEGNDRNELKSRAESRYDDFERLGINPWNSF